MKKGFTLVELLAVIVILAVILVIAVPQINSVIKQTKKNSLASTAKLIAAKAEEKIVENDALENNEVLTCANLVKLDDNYGSCSVRVTNGVATVTLRGTGKFAGLKCTGTKGNMTCTESNTPEYVYAYDEIPHYTYTVKDGKGEECKTYLVNNMKETMINNWGRTAAEAQAEIEAVCSNSNDVFNNPTYLHSASEWFWDEIRFGDFTYDDISSFVEKSDNSGLVGGTTDYTTLNEEVFLRWPGDAIDLDNPEICILYRGNTNNDMNCFKYTTYEETLQSIANVFGKENCSGIGVGNLTLLDNILGIDSVYAWEVKEATCGFENGFSCTLHGDAIICDYNESGCSVDYSSRSIGCAK